MDETIRINATVPMNVYQALQTHRIALGIRTWAEYLKRLAETVNQRETGSVTVDLPKPDLSKLEEFVNG